MFEAKVAKRGHFGWNTVFLKCEDLEKLIQQKSEEKDVALALSSLTKAVAEYEDQEGGDRVPEGWKKLHRGNDE